jgi:hypothetical protein
MVMVLVTLHCVRCSLYTLSPALRSTVVVSRPCDIGAYFTRNFNDSTTTENYAMPFGMIYLLNTYFHLTDS